MLLDSKVCPVRTMMASPEWYRELDKGIRFAVRVLHAHNIETCQSCEGGEGHSYDRPSVDMIASHNDAQGFAAVAHLSDYGLGIRDLSIVWHMNTDGLPYEKLWRVTLWKPCPERANEIPLFIYGAQAQR